MCSWEPRGGASYTHEIRNLHVRFSWSCRSGETPRSLMPEIRRAQPILGIPVSAGPADLNPSRPAGSGPSPTRPSSRRRA
jgi:hypothetical protein